MRDHPDKFRRGCGASWAGRVYAGGAMCAEAGSVIYHGEMGMAPYQQLYLTMQPQRPLPYGYQGFSARVKLTLAQHVQPWVRAVSRWRYSLGWRKELQVARPAPQGEYFKLGNNMGNIMMKREVAESRWWGGADIFREHILEALIDDGWRILGEPECGDWDVTRDDAKLLVACEVHDHVHLVLVRIEVDCVDAPPLTDGVEHVLLGCGLAKK